MNNSKTRKTYKITRFFQDGFRMDIDGGLTLEEALEHCLDPNTSSKTIDPAMRDLKIDTLEGRHGAWFDGYAEE